MTTTVPLLAALALFVMPSELSVVIMTAAAQTEPPPAPPFGPTTPTPSDTLLSIDGDGNFNIRTSTADAHRPPVYFDAEDVLGRIDAVSSIQDNARTLQRTLDNVALGRFGYTPALPATSCSHVLDETPKSPSGTYHLIHEASSTIYPVYCDMDTHPGGWTLVLMVSSKQNKSSSPFYYDGPGWTLATPINPTVTDINANVDMKNLAYSTLSVVEIRVSIGKTSVYNAQTFITSSVMDMFTGPSNTVNAGRDAFINYMTSNGVDGSAWSDPNCNLQGFNHFESGQDGGSACRYGILMNDQNDCNSPDSAIGLGCYSFGQPKGPKSVASGGFHDDPLTVYEMPAWVFVR